MNTPTTPWALLNQPVVFLVWGPPSHGPRSQVLARELGIRELHFVHATTKRGWRSALVKYPYQAAATLALLFARRPKVVIVQSPPSLAVLFVAGYCALTGSQYLVDAHSAAFTYRLWLWPGWLVRWLARRAVTTLVTNEHFQQIIQGWGGHAFVLHDVPTTFPRAGAYPLRGEFNVVVINTFAPDEPLQAILETAAGCQDVQFYVTGRKQNAPPGVFQQAPANVHFTDFLPNETYYALLDSAQTVLCLTTRNHTMQRGACEALWLGKPIITSNWPLLRDYFCQGTVHVDNTAAGIRAGVLEMKKNHARLAAEIQELQAARRQEWQAKIEELAQWLRRKVRE